MRKILGAAFALIMVLSLVLIPATVLAQAGEGGLAKCEWDAVKWEDNSNSWNLYVMHWGRTPITAMSRLAGLAGPNIGGVPVNCQKSDNTANCWQSGCAGCRATEVGFLAGCSDPVNCTASQSEVACPAIGMTEGECPAAPIYKEAKCCCCWGISLAFANKGWAGADIGSNPIINNDNPNHRGNEIGSGSNAGGDWGISGCSHTECIAQTWCLQDNLRTSPGIVQ